MSDESIENPTQEGASIEERLENYLAAEDSPESTEPPVQESQAQEAETETEVETESDDAQESSDEPQLTTSDLAKYLDIDESLFDTDEEGNLFIKTKIDGQEGRAKFQDVLKSYQMTGHVDNQAREVAEQRKALQAQAAEHQQAVQQKFQQAEEIVSIAYQNLMQESAAIDWAALSRDDPAEYIAKQHEFQARKNQLDQSVEAISANKTQQIQQHLQAEAQKLFEVLPEWKDPAVRDKERAEIMEYLVSDHGYSPQFLTVQYDQQGRITHPGITDHKLVLIAKKAMLFDRMQRAKPAAENKVRTAPKLVKPGQPIDAKKRGSENVRDLKSKIHKSGGKLGIEDYLLATGKV